MTLQSDLNKLEPAIDALIAAEREKNDDKKYDIISKLSRPNFVKLQAIYWHGRDEDPYPDCVEHSEQMTKLISKGKTHGQK